MIGASLASACDGCSRLPSAIRAFGLFRSFLSMFRTLPAQKQFPRSDVLAAAVDVLLLQ